MSHGTTIPTAFLKARPAFVSSLIPPPSGRDLGTLVLKDRTLAARTRDHLAAALNLDDGPQVLVLDLEGIAFTPSALQELVLPLAQRIRGGEYGMVRFVVSTTDPGVGDFIRYMAQAHNLPLYLSESPFDLRGGNPLGVLTSTKKNTLNTVSAMGGQVTASGLASAEGITPNAATNRLVNLDREGYLIRQPRGRRDGDLYVEPRAATADWRLSVLAEHLETGGSARRAGRGT